MSGKLKNIPSRTDDQIISLSLSQIVQVNSVESTRLNKISDDSIKTQIWNVLVKIGQNQIDFVKLVFTQGSCKNQVKLHYF